MPWIEHICASQAKLCAKRDPAAWTNSSASRRDKRLNLHKSCHSQHSSQRPGLAQGGTDVAKCLSPDSNRAWAKESGLVMLHLVCYHAKARETQWVLGSEVLIPTKHMCHAAPGAILFLCRSASHLSSKQLMMLHFTGLQCAHFLHRNSPEHGLRLLLPGLFIPTMILKHAVMMFSK